MGEFTHFNEQGHAVMVDVSEKSDTVREATAMGRNLNVAGVFRKSENRRNEKRRCSWNGQNCRDHGS